MNHYKLISTWIAAVTMILPAAAATGHDVITTAQIAAAINDAGVSISPKQVTLLFEVVARTNSPVLRVRSMESLGVHRMKVRLDCTNSEECVPFYVTIDKNGDNLAEPSPIAPSQGREPSPLARLRTGSDTPVMRAGSNVVLLLDGDRMQIELPVVCLENGSIGQTIWVASRDRRQTYTAQVFDAGTLRGRL